MEQNIIEPISILSNHQVSSGSTPSKTINAQYSKNIYVQIVCTGLDTADTKVKLQDSLDGVFFCDLLDSTGNVMELTLSAGDSVNALRINGDTFAARFIRMVFDAGTATQGTINAKLSGK